MFLRPWFSALSIGILSLVAIAAWYAGRESSSIRSHQLTAELNTANYKLAAAQSSMDEERAKREQLERTLRNLGGGNSTVSRENDLRRKTLESDAIMGQFRSIVKRQQLIVDDQAALIDMLSRPNVRLLTLAPEFPDDGSAIGYALIREHNHLILFVSNLPAVSAGRSYCLWLERRAEAKFIRIAVLAADESGRAQVHYSDPSVLTDFDGLRVTVEPNSNTKSPTGKLVLLGENDEN